MATIITVESMRVEIRKLAAAAKLKANQLDESFLQRADSRAVQGGACCEIAASWRKLAENLYAAAREIEFD